MHRGTIGSAVLVTGACLALASPGAAAPELSQNSPRPDQVEIPAFAQDRFGAAFAGRVALDASTGPTPGKCVDQHIARSQVDKPGYLGMIKPSVGDTRGGRISVRTSAGLGQLSSGCRRIVERQTATYYLCTVPTPKKRAVILRSGSHDLLTNGKWEQNLFGRKRLKAGQYVFRTSSMITTKNQQFYQSGDWVYRINVSSSGVSGVKTSLGGRDAVCGTFTPDSAKP